MARKPGQAVDALRRSCAIREKLIAKNPEVSEYRQRLAAVYSKMSELELLAGSRERALATARRELTLRQELAERFPKTPTYRLELARARRTLGSLYVSNSKPEQAIAPLRQSAAEFEKLRSEIPPDEVRQLLHSLGQCYVDLGNAHANREKLTEAASAYNRALGIQEELAAQDRKNLEYQFQLAQTRCHLGNLHLRLKNLSAASAYLDQALPVLEELARSDEANTGYQTVLADSYHTRGLVSAERSQPEAAYADFCRSQEILEKLAALPWAAELLDVLAWDFNKLANQGQPKLTPAQARGCLERAVAIEKAQTAAHPKESKYLVSLGRLYAHFALYLEASRPREAIGYYQRGITTLHSVWDRDRANAEAQEWLAKSYTNLAIAYQRSGQREQAIAALHESRQLRVDLVTHHPDNAAYGAGLASTYFRLGELYVQAKMSAAALDAFRQAATIQEKLIADHPEQPDYQTALASSYRQQSIRESESGKRDQAAATVRRELAAWRRLVTSHPTVGTHRADLDICQKRLGLLLVLGQPGKPGQGIEVLRRAIAEQTAVLMFPLVMDPTPQLIGLAHLDTALGLALKMAQKRDQAASAYRQAAAVLATVDPGLPQVVDLQSDLADDVITLARSHFQDGESAQAAALFDLGATLYEKLGAARPEEASYQLQQAAARGQRGNLLRYEQPQVALAESDKAIRIAEAMLRKQQAEAAIRDLLRAIYGNKAVALAELNRYPEALAAWDQALKWDTGAHNAILRLERAGTLARSGQYDRALNEAETLLRPKDVPSDQLYDAACVFALSSAAVARDAGLPAAERKERAARYADRAMALLVRAQKAGHFKTRANVANMQKDPDLDTLRRRDDFQKLMADLRKPVPPRKRP
jgi:tetratricopeptide (TPR) repeat protein